VCVNERHTATEMEEGGEHQVGEGQGEGQELQRERE